MDRARPDLNLLAVFETILSEGNVTRAGEKLGMTQSAVSHALNRLREITGDELFERTGHGMRPTPRAEKMAPDIKQALLLANRSLFEPLSFDPTTAEQRFAVALPAGLDIMITPPFVQCLSGAPGIDVNFYAGKASSCTASLKAGDTHVALDYEPSELKGFRSVLLLSDRLVCVARQGHPALRSGLTVELFQQLGHVAVNWDRSRTSSLLNGYLGRHNIRRRSRVCVANLYAMMRIVASSDLIGATWRGLAANDISEFGLEVHELPFPMGQLPIYMVWHESFDSDPGHRWLREELSRTCKGLSSPSAARSETAAVGRKRPPAVALA